MLNKDVYITCIFLPLTAKMPQKILTSNPFQLHQHENEILLIFFHIQEKY